MSVLIRGMEMPKNCKQCFFRASGCKESKHNNGRPQDCPLIPVPPHGDLIDRDAYKKLLRGLGSRDYRREKGTICDAIKFLHPHYAPTIIPASDKDINVLGKKEGET